MEYSLVFHARRSRGLDGTGAEINDIAWLSKWFYTNMFLHK